MTLCVFAGDVGCPVDPQAREEGKQADGEGSQATLEPHALEADTGDADSEVSSDSDQSMDLR